MMQDHFINFFNNCIFIFCREVEVEELVKSMSWRIQRQSSLLRLRHVPENKQLMNNSKLVVCVINHSNISNFAFSTLVYHV